MPERAKRCRICKKVKSLDDYARSSYAGGDGHIGACRECQAKAGAQNNDRVVAQFLVRNARKRAKRMGIECTLQWTDIEIPERCPITDVKLKRNLGVQGPDSYTLDRINPFEGYVPGNVKVISLKANRAKADLTVPELRKLIDYIQNKD